MKIAETIAGVYTYTHTHCTSTKRKNNSTIERYTLINGSVVIFNDQKCENKIKNIRIEDSFKKCA